MSASFEECIQSVIEFEPTKLVISKPANKDYRFKKIVVKRKKEYYQFARYTQKQVFHENVQLSNLSLQLNSILKNEFLQLDGWSESYEFHLLLSKKGAVTLKKKKINDIQTPINAAHNREKNYIFRVGNIIPPLVDMGIFTQSGNVVKSMYDKFKQINRFIELVNDAVSAIPEGSEFHVIDFGCGKSYLTFILYYYFQEIKHFDIHMVGLDLKEDVIKKCNLTAQKYGYHNLKFELGDINGYQNSHPVDMVVTLHACDTATDYALMNAISWNAKMIFSVPCCQHEWNQQMKTSDFSILSRYGIIQERFSALATDAVRANLLECCGYHTQLLEFVDFENTPKNLLIRAILKPMISKVSKQAHYKEVTSLVNQFHTSPTLLQLLEDNGYLKDCKS